MAYNWAPYVFWTFFWIGLIAAAVGLIASADNDGLDYTRKTIKVIAACLIFVFVIGNLLAWFVHADYCDDHYDRPEGCSDYVPPEDDLG